MRLRAGLMLSLVIAATACSKNEAASGAPPAKSLAPPRQMEQATFLAYEHEVHIELAVAQIQQRMATVQASCQSGKYGQCVVLNVSQQRGERPSGEVTVRIVPDGVEALVGLAAQGAQIGSRTTHAEDLAQIVADNSMQQLRLEKEHARLMQFQERKDLAVSDLLAISKQLSEIEASAELAKREGAQHRRRIDTQLLTLAFNPPDGQQGRGEISQAFGDFSRILATSVAWLVRACAALLPLALVSWVLAFVWRRRRRRSGHKP